VTRFETPQAGPSPYTRYGRPSDLAFWLVTALFLGVLAACWALGVPRFGAPDENDHARKAAATVRGQTIGEPSDLPGGYRILSIPGPLLGGQPDCFNFDSDVSAACQTFDGAPTGEVDAAIATGLYPPGAYLLPGVPTLFSTDARVVWAMRLAAAAACCAAVGLAAVWARSTRRPDLSLLGLLAALTPMCLFLFGSVNPSGQEIAWFLAVWAGLLLVATAPARPSGRMIVSLGATASAAVLMRQLTPLWLGLAVVLAVVAARPGRVGEVARSPATWAAGALVVVAGAFQVGWLAWSGLLTVPADPRVAVDAPAAEIWRASFGFAWGNVLEMVGSFGWLDVPTPTVTLVLWLALVGLLLVGALVIGSRRTAAAVLLAALATWLVPVVLEARQVATAGFWWQGRYTLPLAVGIPLLAGFGLASDLATSKPISTRVRLVVSMVFVLAHAAAFYVTLRRFTVGLSGPLWFFGAEEWVPPVPALLLLVVATVASAGLCAWVLAPANRAVFEAPAPPGEEPVPPVLVETAHG
jgi:hypothetical protein